MLQSIRSLVVLSVVLLVVLRTANVQAELLQVIHANDLHAHLEHSGDVDRGGYAALKTVMDRIHRQADAEGIPVLRLNGGDFLEGSQFYFAEQGLPVWHAMNALNWDAVVLGNHDWQMGPADLDRTLGRIDVNFSILGANYLPSTSRRNIVNNVHPYAEFRKGKIKAAVIGLTTDELLYSWRAEDCDIVSPWWSADEALAKVRARNDIVIALTHIGVSADKFLVEMTSGLDVVVGGHSHSALHQPVYHPDWSGRPVPIVQAGRHGQWVGDLLIDVVPGKPAQVIRYRLVPVNNSTEEHDHHVAEAVASARDALESQYGRAWLHEVVGHSDRPLERPDEGSAWWADFQTEAIRKSAAVDVAMDVPEFYGPGVPAGEITREHLMKMYPRQFELNQRNGWSIWKARVWGSTLKIILDETVKRGFYLHWAGMTYDKIKKRGKWRAREIRVGGKKLRQGKLYSVALPEGIVRAAFSITPVLKTVLMKAKNTRIPVWRVLEENLRKYYPAPSP